MKLASIAVLVTATLPLVAGAGEVFGTIRTDKGPVAEGTKVAAKCGANAFGPAATDKRGAYRLVINQVGKCTLTVTHDAKSATIDVVSFDNAAQTDIVLKLDAAGQLTATRG
jgi:hypothetical protein